jgi:hypothetical protein
MDLVGVILHIFPKSAIVPLPLTIPIQSFSNLRSGAPFRAAKDSDPPCRSDRGNLSVPRVEKGPADRERQVAWDDTYTVTLIDRSFGRIFLNRI